MRIDGNFISEGCPCYLIAEVGLAHEGSLGNAMRFVEIAKEAGADAVKFQTHIASEESTIEEQFRIKFSKQDKSRFDYWKRTGFSKSEWEILAKFTEELEITFLSSPFSVLAIDWLEDIGVKAWKVGSGEFFSSSIIERLISTNKPIILSTGMATEAEVSDAYDLLKSEGVEFSILQCTSEYPSDFQSVGLNVLENWIKKFNCPIGLSDHSGTIYPAIAAISSGASIVELHITMSRDLFGPDIVASVTKEEFKLISGYRDAFQIMKHQQVDKDQMADNLKNMRGLFSKSLCFNSAYQKGTIVNEDMLQAKKPGTGISPDNAKDLVGKTLARDVDGTKLIT